MHETDQDQNAMKNPNHEKKNTRPVDAYWIEKRYRTCFFVDGVDLRMTPEESDFRHDCAVPVDRCL